jgi:hypothetical protein
VKEEIEKTEQEDARLGKSGDWLGQIELLQ